MTAAKVECPASPTGLHERTDMAGEKTCKHCGAWAMPGPIPTWDAASMEAAKRRNDGLTAELEESQRRLNNIIAGAMRWAKHAHWLFLIGCALNVTGLALFVMNLLRMRALCGVLP